MDQDICLYLTVDKIYQDAEVWQGSIVVKLLVGAGRWEPWASIQMNHRGSDLSGSLHQQPTDTTLPNTVGGTLLLSFQMSQAQ